MTEPPNYPPLPTVADLLANPPTREEIEAAALRPSCVYAVREPLPVLRSPLRFGGFLVGTGEGVLDELERELPGASRAEILEWCVGQLDGEALDDDAAYRFEIDKLKADPSPSTVEFLRRYCTLRPEPAG